MTRRRQTSTRAVGTWVVLGVVLALAPATAGAASAPASVTAKAVKSNFGKPLATTSWSLPSGSAGLIDAGQGPGFGQGGIVSWNGALWFAEEDAGHLGRIDSNGRITDYVLPAAVSNPGYGPRQLSASSDGLWFLADWGALEGRAARMNRQGNIDGYFSGGSHVRLSSVTATADGGAWITYADGEGVSRLAANGNETQFFNQPRYGGDSESTLGPDKALWLSDGSSVIQRIRESGTVTNFAATGDAGDIVSLTTSGGSVWYAKFNPGTWVTPSRSGVVGKMSTSGVAKPFTSPYPDLLPAALTPAADGGVWFTTHHGAGVGHVDRAGRYRVALMPQGQSADSVTVGPDGNLWFTDRALNRVGMITMAAFNASITSQTTSPRARVAAGKGTVVKGRAKVRIACVSGSGSQCRGTVQVKKGKKTFAKGRYSVKGGKKKTVAVKLTKAGRKFFRTHHSARLPVVLKSKAGPAKRKVAFRRKS